MVAKYSWGLVRTLRWAKHVAPELFVHLHPDTPRKWIAEPLAEKRGRRVLCQALSQRRPSSRKTTRGTPTGPLPHGVNFHFTRSHWMNCDSFYSMLDCIDSNINPTSPGRPGIALLDCASVYISKEFLSNAREPHIGWVHICGSQPLDVAFMKAFKVCDGANSW